jgi:hypothetical protein
MVVISMGSPRAVRCGIVRRPAVALARICTFAWSRGTFLRHHPCQMPAKNDHGYGMSKKSWRERQRRCATAIPGLAKSSGMDIGGG